MESSTDKNVLYMRNFVFKYRYFSLPILLTVVVPFFVLLIGGGGAIFLTSGWDPKNNEEFGILYRDSSGYPTSLPHHAWSVCSFTPRLALQKYPAL